MIDVSVIIVNYNTTHWVRRCLSSIVSFTKNNSYEIIVVDNHSEDDSITAITNDFQDVRLFLLEKNIGFGGACNVASKKAQGKFLFLLNPDTCLCNDAIHYFTIFWEQHHLALPIACLGAPLLDEQMNTQHSYGEFPKLSNLIVEKIKSTFRVFRKNTSSIVQEYSKINLPYLAVDYVTGADLFIEHAILQRYGGFDKQFFMYYEETDLQKRMHNDGLQSYLIQGPIIKHTKGVSTHNQIAQLRVFNFNSLIRYAFKHYPAWQACVFSVIWPILDGKTFIQKLILGIQKKQ